MAARLEVVDLVSRGTLGPPGRELVDLLIDGRAATDHERALVGSATLEEVNDGLALVQLHVDLAAAEADAAHRAEDVMRPFFDAGARTVGEVLSAMPPALRAQTIEALEACHFAIEEVAG
jgi:hypothetical protein